MAGPNAWAKGARRAAGFFSNWANDRAEWLRTCQAGSAIDDDIDGEHLMEDGDDDFPNAKFLTYWGAAEVFFYHDHFAFFASPSTPDIKAWVPLTALTWKQVSIIWRTETAQDQKQQLSSDSVHMGSTKLPQPACRAESTHSTKTASGDTEDDVVSTSLPEKQPVIGEDGSLTVVSSEESLIVGDEATASITDEAPTTVAVSGNSEGVVSPASAEGPCGRLAPVASNNGFTARDDNDGLDHAAAAEGIAVNGMSEDPEESSAEGLSLVEDCASEESFPGDCDPSDTVSWGERRVDNAVPPSEVAGQQAYRNSTARHPAISVAQTSNSTKATESKIEKEARDDRRGVAPGRIARAWLGGEKWNMAASAGPSLPPPFRKLRLLTTPPEGWEYGPGGRWVVKKPPTPPPCSCRQQSPLPKKATDLEDGWWGSGRRPLV